MKHDPSRDDAPVSSDTGPTEATSRPRVAIYARCAASDDSVKAIESQVGRCRNFAAEHDSDVVRVFEDANRSGARVAGRSGLAAMIGAAERGEFDVVLVECVYRLSRNSVDVCNLVEQMENRGVSVWAVEEGVVRASELRFRPTPPAIEPLVRRIVEDYLAGASISDICAALNAEGSVPPSSARG